VKHPLRGELTRDQLVSWFREGRARSVDVFSIPGPEYYYERPIALRNPIVFYEGHLPAFTVNTLLKFALKRPGINADYERLFERGIDPESEATVTNVADLWPKRADVQAYGARANQAIEEALQGAELERDRGEATLAILEHEQMHQETLLYMFHNMPYEKKVRREALRKWGARPSLSAMPLQSTESEGLTPHFAQIPAGVATLGSSDPFGWDNEYPQHTVHVDAFSIDRDNVTNAQYLDFMHATGASAPHFWTRVDGEWFWRGMFELIPLPLDWPVYVMHDEAAAHAKWRGARLPSEAEYHRAAFGTPSGEERQFPWGDEPPDHTRGNFDFTHWDPVPVGSYPKGASAWGVRDLVGNGWEWTSTKFAGFPGFKPMASYPVYSADFFDNEHYVIKGASPATARDLVRRSFRNWFRPNYPYLYATFRCVY